MDRNDFATRLAFVFAAFWLVLALVLAMTGTATLGQRLGLVAGAFVVTVLGIFLRRVYRRERDNRSQHRRFWT